VHLRRTIEVKLANQVFVFGAVALGALLLRPTEVHGFDTIGGSLGLSFRDVRVFNNFTDTQANANTAVDPDWPGYDGAELAIWKGCGEWASELHGLNGRGDPHQPNGLGSGGANFDPTWQGNHTGIGGANGNVHSEISGTGGTTLAFTETPIFDGWRIRYYADPWVWNDGPGTGLSGGVDAVDMQGVAAHEYGHALGLGHSSNSAATMFASTSSGGVPQRSINNDDQQGVRFIYGVLDAATKPHIGSVNLVAGVVTITGTNFSATQNEVWFTQATAGGNGTPVKIIGVASNGNSLSVTVPASAGPGDILVKRGGVATHAGLSNAFPFDPTQAQNPFATDLNIDIGVSAGLPGSGQGQAANNVGEWNTIPMPALGLGLVDLAGDPTSAVITGAGGGGEFTFDHPATIGGFGKLLDDRQDVGCTPGATSVWEVSGMAAGTYDVYVYAWASDDPLNSLTDVTVSGGSAGTQTCGGVDWTGSHVLGGTYVVDQAQVASDGGSILVTVTQSAGCGAINGLQILPGTACNNPLSYCTGGTSASGCVATLSATGTPSATATSGFSLLAGSVEGLKDGLFFFGANGRQANAWGNGTSFQCVVPPVSRGGLLTATGTAGVCDGAFSQDLNALWCSTCPGAPKNPGAGATTQAQLWYRDPMNTSNQTTSLSSALEFVLCP
jgi:hypothetical protein